MMWIEAATNAFERVPLPDAISRAAIAALVGRTHRRLGRNKAEEDSLFAIGMRHFPVAEHTDLANEQHYELPADFFKLMLGPQRKYSCCYYESPEMDLAEAEEAALGQTAKHAGLADGQRILELGCGWGSLSLWMAEHYPNAEITAVSNSKPQRLSIEAEAQARGITNLTVLTRDMNDFATDQFFDRVVSVEMFEHMANWRALLARVRKWLAPEGRLFVHVFTHEKAPYRFLRDDKTDWIAQHFFTGGIMPSHGLMHHFQDLFSVEADWRWNGKHYERTALDWLANYNRHADEIDNLMRLVYGPEAALWRRRWRLFLLATAGLFGHLDGAAWGVSHYLLKPSP